MNNNYFGYFSFPFWLSFALTRAHSFTLAHKLFLTTLSDGRSTETTDELERHVKKIRQPSARKNTKLEKRTRKRRTISNAHTHTNANEKERCEKGGKGKNINSKVSKPKFIAIIFRLWWIQRSYIHTCTQIRIHADTSIYIYIHTKWVYKRHWHWSSTNSIENIFTILLPFHFSWFWFCDGDGDGGGDDGGDVGVGVIVNFQLFLSLFSRLTIFD